MLVRQWCKALLAKVAIICIFTITSMDRVKEVACSDEPREFPPASVAALGFTELYRV